MPCPLRRQPRPLHLNLLPHLSKELDDDLSETHCLLQLSIWLSALALSLFSLGRIL